MIKVMVATDGKKIHDSFDIEKPTLSECALIVYRLEQIIADLLDKEFETEFEVSSGDYADG